MALFNAKMGGSSAADPGFVVSVSNADQAAATNTYNGASNSGLVIVPGSYTALSGSVTISPNVTGGITYKDGTFNAISGSSYTLPSDVSNVLCIAIRPGGSGTLTANDVTLS